MERAPRCSPAPTPTATISAGTLQIGNAGTTGTLGTANVVNNAALAFNRSNALTVANVISGSGQMTQSGSGALTLTAVNSYTGATTVNAGSLLVNGSIATSSGLAVNGGALAGGTGTLPATLINAGGTLSPGNSIGTVTVQGNLTFANGGIYAVEVSPVAADRTNVTGTAALAGTVQATMLPGSNFKTQYTILSSAGLGGTTFSGLAVANGQTNFDTSLSYTATDVLLNVTAVLRGLTVNEQAVAKAINGFFNNGGTLPPGFLTIFGLTGNASNAALTQISGEVGATSAQTGMQMMSAFLSQMINPYSGAPGGNPGSLGYARAVGAADNSLPKEAAEAYAAVMPAKAAMPQSAHFAGRWQTWGQSYGGANKTNGDSVIVGSHDISSRIWGLAAGADYSINDAVVGFALAGGETSWGLSQGLGTGKSDVFQAGAYASHRFGAAFVSGSIAYSWHDITTNRTVTIAGTDNLTGRFQAANVGARIETGYRFGDPTAAITPYAAAQAQSFTTPSYSETATSGTQQFALAYNAKSITASRTELGYWIDTTIALANNDAVAWRVRAAWANDSGNGRGASATFQALPGASFTVLGAKAPTNLALFTAGAELRLHNDISLGAKGDVEVASRSNTFSGTATLRKAW